jgi:SAM-dependent methyltransferase
MTSEKMGRGDPQTYLLDNSWERARERLDMLGAFLDPATIRHLGKLGVDKGWHCWEVGGGGGSIAEWLCRRVGPSGRVVATDIDPRFLRALQEPNLEVHESDIAASPVETGTFDLVHARLLLEHVPDRHAALRHMAAGLKPDGWLLLEEMDHVNWLPDPAVEAAKQDIWRKFLEAYRLTMDARGGDMETGRRLVHLLRTCGLVNIQTDGWTTLLPGGSLGARVLQLTLAQAGPSLVATGAINDKQMDALLSFFEDPDFVVMLPLLMAASGRRPSP